MSRNAASAANISAILVLSANVAFAFLVVNAAAKYGLSRTLADVNLTTSICNLSLQLFFLDGLFGFEDVVGMPVEGRRSYYHGRAYASIVRGLAVAVFIALLGIVGLGGHNFVLLLAGASVPYLIAYSVSSLYQYAVLEIGFARVQIGQLVAVLAKTIVFFVLRAVSNNFALALLLALLAQQITCAGIWIWVCGFDKVLSGRARRSNAMPKLRPRDVVNLIILNRDTVQNTVDQALLRFLSITVYSEFALIGPFLALARQLPGALIDRLRGRLAVVGQQDVRSERRRFIVSVALLEAMLAIGIGVASQTLRPWIPLLSRINPLLGLLVAALGLSSGIMASQLFRLQGRWLVVLAFTFYAAVCGLGALAFKVSVGLTLPVYLATALVAGLMVQALLRRAL